MKSKFFGILLIIGMCLGFNILSTSVSAASIDITGWKLTYTVSNGEVTITGGTKTGSSNSLEIPDKISGCSVTKIGDSAFKDNPNLLYLTLPNSITHIGNSAFEGTILYNIYGTTNLAYIGEYAFYGCDCLQTFAIPDSVTYIGYEAFYNCQNLETITIPKNITYIDGGAFRKCYKLRSAVIPEGITVINPWVFEDSGLKSIILADSVEVIKNNAFDGCDSLESITLSNNLKTIDNSAFSSCKNLKSISIPESVETIGSYAFSSCHYGLTSITIPEGVKTIGEHAFENCYYLVDLTISDSVKTIGDYAFYNCKFLETVTIPDGVENIGGGVFSGCDILTSINVSEENQYFDSVNGVLFDKDKKTLIQYPEGKTDTNYIIADGVMSIGGSAFYGCNKLTSITIPDSVTAIGVRAFSGCSALTELHIPDGITTIESYTFSGCGILTKINIPNGITTIGESAFSGCKSLTDITIPESVKSVGRNAFSSTGYYNDTANWENNVLYIGKYLIKAKSQLAGDYKVKDGTLVIANDAFIDCDDLTGITISDSVTDMGTAMFAFLPNLKTVHLGNGIKTIGKNTFDSCKKLESITIPNSVNHIESAAFYACPKLTKVYYKGTQEDWNNIKIDSYNGTITNVVDVIYIPFTKTTVSENKKSITITPVNVGKGKMILLALYNGNQFVGIQPSTYNGESVPFTTDVDYTNAKIMIWDDLASMKPVGDAEYIE